MDTDEASGKRLRMVLGLVLASIWFVFGAFSLPARAQSGEVVSATAISGKLSNLRSDQRVVQNGRWFLVREFTVEFTVQDSAHYYCGEIITTDTTEAHDLINSGGQTVDIQEHGKDLYLTLKDGRKLHTRRLNENQCPRT